MRDIVIHKKEGEEVIGCTCDACGRYFDAEIECEELQEMFHLKWTGDTVPFLAIWISLR